MSPIIHYPPANPDTNSHYRTLSDRRKHSYITNQEPETGRGSTGNKLERRVNYKIQINTDGISITNRNRLCSKIIKIYPNIY